MLLHPIRCLHPERQVGRGYLLDRSTLLSHEPIHVWCSQRGRWCVGHRSLGRGTPVVEVVDVDGELIPIVAHCTQPIRTARSYVGDDPRGEATQWASDVRNITSRLMYEARVYQGVPEMVLADVELDVLADLLDPATNIHEAWGEPPSAAYKTARGLVDRGLVRHTAPSSSPDHLYMGVWEVTEAGRNYAPFTRLRELTTEWPKGDI